MWTSTHTRREAPRVEPPWRARVRCVARPMGLSLADLFVAGLLVVNGAAVLNEERFLVKVGWGYEASRNESASVKKQIISLLHAVRLLFTIPLMGLNVVVIVLKLILG